MDDSVQHRHVEQLRPQRMQCRQHCSRAPSQAPSGHSDSVRGHVKAEYSHQHRPSLLGCCLHEQGLHACNQSDPLSMWLCLSSVRLLLEATMHQLEGNSELPKLRTPEGWKEGLWCRRSLHASRERTWYGWCSKIPCTDHSMVGTLKVLLGGVLSRPSHTTKLSKGPGTRTYVTSWHPRVVYAAGSLANVAHNDIMHQLLGTGLFDITDAAVIKRRSIEQHSLLENSVATWKSDSSPQLWKFRVSLLIVRPFCSFCSVALASLDSLAAESPFRIWPTAATAAGSVSAMAAALRNVVPAASARSP